MPITIKQVFCIVLIISLSGCIILPTTAMITNGITNEKSSPEMSLNTLELVRNLGKYNLSKQDQNKILNVLKSRKNIEAIIIKKERELSQKPLKINDNRKGLLLTEEFSLNAKDPNSQIPQGGIIQYSSEGITRVFSSEGDQILNVQDRDVQNVLTPSGKMMPVTHIFAVPENIVVYNIGNRDYYLQDGNILFIKDFGNSYDIASTDKNLLQAGSLSPSWVAWAESDPITDPVVLTSQWVTPYSPDGPTNILFNGIEPYDGTYIIQPVVAFNYPHHNHDGVQWVNHWTGASWLCNEPITCDHSRPVISVNQGETINGGVIRIPLPGAIPDLWIISTSDVNSGRSTTYWKFFEPKSPSKIVMTYEMPVGQIDQLKISDAIFTNIIARDASFSSIPLTMRAQYNIIDKPHLTGLYIDTSQSPSKITIFTDYSFSIIAAIDGNGEIKPSGGAVDPSGRYPIKSNEAKEFTISANPGYSIDNVLVDGQSKGPISSYIFKLVNPDDMKDHIITATFKQIPTTPPGTYWVEAILDSYNPPEGSPQYNSNIIGPSMDFTTLGGQGWLKVRFSPTLDFHDVSTCTFYEASTFPPNYQLTITPHEMDPNAFISPNSDLWTVAPGYETYRTTFEYPNIMTIKDESNGGGNIAAVKCVVPAIPAGILKTAGQSVPTSMETPFILTNETVIR